MYKKIQTLRVMYHEIRNLPRISVNLMIAKTKGNDTFFKKVTRDFYIDARKRHPKFPLVRQMEIGLATCILEGEANNTLSDLTRQLGETLKKQRD